MARGPMVAIAEILKGAYVGREVELRGWIYRTRSMGGKAFVVVRDDTGILQAAVSKDGVPAESFEAVERALIESAVVVRGTVVADKRAPGGYEIRAADVKIVHFAEKFPIQEDLSEEFLLDVRHLWIRSPRRPWPSRCPRSTTSARPSARRSPAPRATSRSTGTRRWNRRGRGWRTSSSTRRA